MPQPNSFADLYPPAYRARQVRGFRSTAAQVCQSRGKISLALDELTGVSDPSNIRLTAVLDGGTRITGVDHTGACFGSRPTDPS